MADQNVIVLHSGGIDSTAMIHFYNNLGYSISAFFFQYGQIAAKKEWLAVQKIGKHYNVNVRKIELRTGSIYKDGLIQGRNLFFLSTALLIEKINYGQVAIGIHAGTNYADCSKQFLNQCNEMFALNSNGKLAVSAPFIDWTKKQIFDYCFLEKVPIKYTYSCELGKKQPCGECSSCKELIALYEAKDK